MIGFCNYSFCFGKDSLNPMPTNLNNIQQTIINNAIFEHINITKDVNFNYNKELPTWDFNTILDCDFENGTSAGNVDFTLDQLTSIKIKRRKKGDFNWITIRDIPINSRSDLNIISRDYLVPTQEEFEWALVPNLNGVEGDYIIGSLSTDFNGVFISDITNSFKLDANISYGSRTSNQAIGQITSLGRRYPIIIKNGNLSYETGSISGMILGDSFNKNGNINRKEIVNSMNNFLNFLKNGNPKIIKDWNGNIYMVMIVGNPTVSYNNNYGMGISTVNFEWVEQGKYDNENDLYNNGFIEISI